MEIVISCIIHEGIVRKLGKRSHIENKEAGTSGNAPGYL